jgi:hypothetical protein
MIRQILLIIILRHIDSRFLTKVDKLRLTFKFIRIINTTILIAHIVILILLLRWMVRQLNRSIIIIIIHHWQTIM